MIVQSESFSITETNPNSQLNIEFKKNNTQNPGLSALCSSLDTNYIFMMALLFSVIILRVKEELIYSSLAWSSVSRHTAIKKYYLIIVTEKKRERNTTCI